MKNSHMVVSKYAEKYITIDTESIAISISYRSHLNQTPELITYQIGSTISSAILILENILLDLDESIVMKVQ
jgi:hypothetical protein